MLESIPMSPTVHTFRFDMTVHACVSLSGASKVNRATNYTACGLALANMQRLAPHHDPTRSAPISCSRCSAMVTTLMDLHGD
jgi:hypothetical protein